MGIALVVIAYFICLLFEIPALKTLGRRKFFLYIVLMFIALMESITVILSKDTTSFASIIQNIFAPISDKIYGS